MGRRVQLLRGHRDGYGSDHVSELADDDGDKLHLNFMVITKGDKFTFKFIKW